MALHLQCTTNNIPETVVKEARFKGKESKANVTQFPPHQGGRKGKRINRGRASLGSGEDTDTWRMGLSGQHMQEHR